MVSRISKAIERCVQIPSTRDLTLAWWYASVVTASSGGATTIAGPAFRELDPMFTSAAEDSTMALNLRPPLVLLHGVTNSAHIWDDVAPLLSEHFDLLVPTAAGHRGGAPNPGRLTISRLVDDVERLLDHHGLTQAHLAGNSMGGWMAIELARRGRALSVCALSPAGFWTPGDRDETHATDKIRAGRRRAALAMPIVPLALRSRRIRRAVLRDAAEHGDRLRPRQAVEIVRDLVACEAAPDLLGTTEFIDTLTARCPITLAWSRRDRIFPAKINGANARRLIPDATYLELDDVGHVPMIDDPALCATVIRDACA